MAELELRNAVGRLVAVLDWLPGRASPWTLWRVTTNRAGLERVEGCDAFKTKRAALAFARRVLKAE